MIKKFLKFNKIGAISFRGISKLSLIFFSLLFRKKTNNAVKSISIYRDSVTTGVSLHSVDMVVVYSPYRPIHC